MVLFSYVFGFSIPQWRKAVDRCVMLGGSFLYISSRGTRLWLW